MTGATAVLIKLGVRLVVFGLVFFFATRRNPSVIVEKKRTLPLIALVYAVLSTALYWGASKLLNIATFGTLSFAMPFIINLGLLLGTLRVFESKRWIRVEGIFATLWLAMLLTLAHGALWLTFDVLWK